MNYKTFTLNNDNIKLNSSENMEGIPTLKYKTVTLGCKVNQYETQALEVMLKNRGFMEATSDEIADLVIVNTCAVTGESGRKSRHALRKLQKENPNAISAACGCFSQLEPEALEEMGIDVINGSGSKEHFADDILRACMGKEKIKWTDEPFKRREFEELHSGSHQGRTRAMLKIQDGCVNFCTYCIIPYTRGRLRSLPVENCAKQAHTLAQEGYMEVVVTGIEIASYGVDLEGKPSLTSALVAIAENSGDMRIRLGSLEPTIITEEFCKTLAATNKICNHFHLSLQSGCDKTLKNMNRKYDTKLFYEKVELLRKYFPDCGLTADLIVGFPDETDADHNETLEFIEKINFSYIHIFPYSIRPGTKAADMPNQVPNQIKSIRAKEAHKIMEKCEDLFLDTCIDKTFPVLFETEHDGLSIGHGDNYRQMCVEGGQLKGLVKNVKIFTKKGKMLVGKVV